MSEVRLYHNQIDTISSHLNKAIHATDSEMQMFYVEKAEKTLAELRRELWLSKHRSGEVKK